MAKLTTITSAQNQIILKSVGVVLEDNDVEILLETLTHARNELDMDNMTAINTLNTIIKALEKEVKQL